MPLLAVSWSCGEITVANLIQIDSFSYAIRAPPPPPPPPPFCSLVISSSIPISVKEFLNPKCYIPVNLYLSNYDLLSFSLMFSSKAYLSCFFSTSWFMVSDYCTEYRFTTWCYFFYPPPLLLAVSWSRGELTIVNRDDFESFDLYLRLSHIFSIL